MKVLVYGAGQLARMMKLSGDAMGIEVKAVDVSNNSVVDPVSKQVFETTLSHAIEQADVLTVEFEHVPEGLLQQAQASGKLFPNQQAILVGADRVREKNLLTELAIANCAHHIIRDVAQLSEAVDALGTELVIKSSRDGYDGYGQWRLNTIDELPQLQQSLSTLDLQKVPLVVEKMTRFDRELSLVGARDHKGEFIFYPLAENLHHQGQLHLSVAPALAISDALQQQAENYFVKLADKMAYVGVMAVEFFQCGEQLLVNEIAPRVHNSGHWSQLGAAASQFENHLRGVCGLPLVSGRAMQPTAMVNVIGYGGSAVDLFELPECQLHWYGKSLRAKRKMGHINVSAADYAGLAKRLKAIAAKLPESSFPVLKTAIEQVIQQQLVTK